MTGKPHRVAHIMPWEGVGGTEQAALRIAQAIKDAGFESTFFCLGSAPIVRDFFASAGYETGTWRACYPAFNGYRYFLHESLQLAREFRNRSVTLVHCADVPAGAYAAVAARLALVPAICHVRNRHQSIPQPDQRFLRAVNRFAFVSRGAWRAFAHRVPERRGAVVYDGVEVPAGGDAFDAASRDVRREFNISSDTTIVGMIARVDQQKDYETLAKAAARIVAATPNVRFLIVGGYSIEDGQRHHFEQVKRWLAENQVSEYFIFTDFRSDVPRLLRAMDIVVLSTHYEGLPLVLLESMAFAKPVVATAVDGVPEIVTDNQTGLLFSHQDDGMLAAHVLSLIRDPSRKTHLGLAGRASIQSRFNNEQFKRGIVSLYDNVLHRNPLSAVVTPSVAPLANVALRAGYAALDANIRRYPRAGLRARRT
jgi:glycosyltransferase involved in cell wall biosynthesis